MTDRSAAHASFTLERTYSAAPARVFAAFATQHAKDHWFNAGDAWTAIEREFDFRIGGRELLAGRWKSGMVTRFDCRYFDIVPDQRIVYAYAMELDGKRISVSMATIELSAKGSQTRLTLTEQGVYLDGFEDGGGREKGTGDLLDRLGAALAEAGG
jgi:uncharacterized protein YndB with AHSA1/START domain